MHDAAPPGTPSSDATLAPPHNRTFDELEVGDRASLQRMLTQEDIRLFAVLSGDAEPQAAEGSAGNGEGDGGVIAHGMWAASLVAALLGTRLPGPGTRYVGQTLRFLAPVRVGDTLTVEVTVTAREPAQRRVRLACRALNQDQAAVFEGEAEVVAPDRRIARSRATLPEVRLHGGTSGAQRLFDHVKPLGAVRMAVVHPCDALSLRAALEARAAGLIEPVLVAPRARLQAAADEAGLDLDGIELEDVAHSHAAAVRAAELAAAGKVEALMKGSLHTDELLAAVLPAAAGLRTKRRISHCFLIETPAYPRPFIITDAAINIAPGLEEKADIVRNAIDLAHAIGVDTPRVAILAAVETVNPRMAATLDAAALCKMAERGQITGGVLDGPLAFDNAVSAAAARIKGIESAVAGRADILVVPDLESGNMLAKQLEFMGDAISAGIVLGAKVPMVLTSRADPHEARMAACALAVLLAHRYRDAPP